MKFRELRRHQWKEFRRHPMFEREMALKILMCFFLLILGVQMFATSLFLSDFLSENGVYNNVIGSFNYYLIYLILFDFTFKYLWKQSQSLRIAPYLTIPIKRSKLFNFILVKEFTNMWNLYLFFFLIPFTFRAIPAFYGYSEVVSYLLFVYLLCIGTSLLVNIANNLLNRSTLYLFLPFIIIAAIIGITFIPEINITGRIVKACVYILEKNIISWTIVLLVFATLWKVNMLMMRTEVYRTLQGKKASEAGTYTLPFIKKAGKYSMFINLQLKMIMRSKRLKSLLYGVIILPVFYPVIVNLPFLKTDYPNLFFMTFFTLGSMGIGLGPFIFTHESSFFDGLMTKKLSLFDLLKSKYIFCVSCSILILLVLMITVFFGNFDFLFLISVFFYTIGPIYFLLFQNAVYNKKFYDHSDNGFSNINSITGSSYLITLLSILIPYLISMTFFFAFNIAIANYFMLITGFIFTLTANYWLKWTYNRFLKRKYKNMEGYRIEA
jgi:hypothetical protein